MPPLLTIGIPCFNRPDDLARLLEQVRNQTYVDYVAIISDNCSTNPEVELLCKKVANLDHRFIYIRQNYNIGAVNNHNFLLSQAKTKYFMFLGDDDEISENYVEECMKIITNDDSISMVGAVGDRHKEGKHWYYYETYSSLGKSCFCRLKELIPLAFFYHWKFEQYWYGIFQVSMHPKSLSGDFKSTLYRFFFLSEKGYFAHAPLATYTKHTTENELKNHALGSAYRRHKLLSLFKDNDVRSLQQCLPISWQMSVIVCGSVNLSFTQKCRLLVLIMYCIFRYSISYELTSKLQEVNSTLGKIRSRLKIRSRFVRLLKRITLSR